MATRTGSPEGDHHRLPPSGGGQHAAATPAAPVRHPADPEPVRASKARAVWWLGLLAVVTGPLLGGAVPATVAVMLAGQFRRDAQPARGFLTGATLARRGERLAWIGMVLATAALAAVVVIGLVHAAAAPPEPRFPPHID